MTTKTICLKSLHALAAESALEILKRLGWAYDEMDENGLIRVDLPIEDEYLFDFLEMCWQ